MEQSGYNCTGSTCMTILREFNDDRIHLGPHEMAPPQDGLQAWFESEAFTNHGSPHVQAGVDGAVTPADTHDEFHLELEAQLLEADEEQRRIPTTMCMPDLLLTGDIQPATEEEPEEDHGYQDIVFAGEDEDSETDSDDESGEDESGEEDSEVMDGYLSEVIDGVALQETVEQRRVQRVVLPPGYKPRGITRHKHNKQWEAHLWIRGHQLRNRKKKGVQIFAGNYATKDEAKRVHDKAAIKFDVRLTGHGKPYPLNFPESEYAAYMAEHSDWTRRDFLWKLRRYSLKFSTGKSGMRGVTVRTRKRRGQDVLRYEAKISKTDDNGAKKSCTIGTFDDEEEAGKAYDRAYLFINDHKTKVEKWHVITNFRPSTYTEDEVQQAGRKLKLKLK